MCIQRILFLVFVLSAYSAWGAWPTQATPFAHAVISPKSGSNVSGTVDFAKTPNGLLIRAYLRGLTPGAHGFHLHEKGDCSSPDAESAGDHYNPSGESHGGPHASKRHAGDFGNVIADKEGNVIFDTKIENPDSAAFYNWNDIVGKAVIVHEKRDDLTSQPAGNAGDRVACGVVERVGQATP